MARTQTAVGSIIPSMNIDALVLEDERADKRRPFADALLDGSRKPLHLRAVDPLLR